MGNYTDIANALGEGTFRTKRLMESFGLRLLEFGNLPSSLSMDFGFCTDVYSKDHWNVELVVALLRDKDIEKLAELYGGDSRIYYEAVASWIDKRQKGA